MLSVDARQSLFLCGEAAIVVEENAGHVDQYIKWVGNANVYSGRLTPDFEGDLADEQQGGSEFFQHAPAGKVEGIDVYRHAL